MIPGLMWEEDEISTGKERGGLVAHASNSPWVFAKEKKREREMGVYLEKSMIK